MAFCPFFGVPRLPACARSWDVQKAFLIRKSTKPSNRRRTRSEMRKSRLNSIACWKICGGCKSGPVPLRPSEPEAKPYRRADTARRFVLRWQKYLSVAASGDLEEARQILESLSHEDDNGLIPRSQILARIHDPAPSQEPATRPAIRKVLDRIKTLDDMSLAYDTLKAMQSDGHRQVGELQEAIAALTPLELAYREFKAGSSTNLENLLTEARMLPNYVIPVRNQLLALILPRYLGLPEDLKPGPDEGVHAFLDRIVADAIAKRNYVLAARAREFQYAMKYNPRETGGSQAATFIAGHNQEEAGQYTLAVASYQKALAMGTDVVPPKVIGERLAAIQKEHPAEYQEGVQLFLAPPQQRRFDPYPHHLGPPARSPNAPRFPVPAASISPSASPTK